MLSDSNNSVDITFKHALDRLRLASLLLESMYVPLTGFSSVLVSPIRMANLLLFMGFANLSIRDRDNQIHGSRPTAGIQANHLETNPRLGDLIRPLKFPVTCYSH